MPQKSERPPMGTGKIAKEELPRQAPEGAVPDSLPHCSLDDVAALLMQLNPSDLERPAVLRDISRKSGKHISFETDGEDTEIDRNMSDCELQVACVQWAQSEV